MWKEMFVLLAGSIVFFGQGNPAGFLSAFLGAVLLAGGLWWACSVYTQLWNTTFHMSLVHHLLCACAAVCTLFVIIAFASVGYAGKVIHREIVEWADATRATLASDTSGHSRTGTTEADLLAEFEASHSFLRSVLNSAGVSLPTTANTGRASVDPLGRVTTAIWGALRDHLDDAFLRLRIALVISFLLAQAIPFGLTGYLAHSDIRPSH